MTEMFATVNARVLCWDALLQLGNLRFFAQKDGKSVPTGLGTTIRGKQIQVDLV